MKNKNHLAILLATIIALSLGVLASCSPSDDGAADTNAAEEDVQAETADGEGAIGEIVQITEAEVDEHCGMCHFQDVENMSINSWNRDTINWGIVESMVPMLDDATIQGIVDYFAAIEPPTDEGGQQ